jgi:hypothetical protein
LLEEVRSVRAGKNHALKMLERKKHIDRLVDQKIIEYIEIQKEVKRPRKWFPLMGCLGCIE